jgi:hypothetical protein
MKQKKNKGKELKRSIEKLKEDLMELMSQLREEGYSSELHLFLNGDYWDAEELSIWRIEEI